MFWKNFVALCSKHNKTPTAVVSELGLAKGNVTSWKRGKIPQVVTQKKIADYFGVDTKYFSIEHAELSENSNEKAPNCGKNMITIMGRDGAFTQKEVTDDQLKALQAIISQLPNASEKM